MGKAADSDDVFIDDVFDGAEATPRKKRSRLSVFFISLGVLLSVGALAIAGVMYAQYQKFESLKTFGDPFAELTDRPTRPADDAGESDASGDPVTFLILGSDSRISAGDPEDWEPGAQRTDAIMVVQVAGDRRSISVMSLPRDSWVDIPGYGQAKINAAFSYGGPALTIETVEQLTGIRIDHFAIVDFASFVALTDLVDGVDITTKTGTTHMSGDEALTYVRERYGLPGGDFDRVRRQQVWVKAVFDSVLTPEILSSPSNLLDIYNSVADHISFDDGLTVNSLVDLGTSLRNINSEDILFLTAPYSGTGTSSDGQSIVLLDEEKLAGLSEAFQEDDVTEWVAGQPELETLDSRPIE
ncbi:MAG: LCP family protein [Ancrocorticia sp.]|uniref:LCP family protein n=1 Tax=Ancrocorticia sp. TaxID=2593684 RepID=UPI003F90EC5C